MKYNMLKFIYWKWFTAKYRYFRNISNNELDILDIGCGSGSPTKTKLVFSKSKYYGIDRGVYHNNQRDIDIADSFYMYDLDESFSLEFLGDKTFDLIIFSHVIEHLENGDKVLASACTRLKPEGQIYVEYPGVRSLSLPHMRGTLNFSDDPTHKRVYDIKEVANIMLSNGVTPIKAGTRRFFLSFLLIIPRFIGFLIFNKSPAGIFWDITGMAEYVLGKRVLK